MGAPVPGPSTGMSNFRARLVSTVVIAAAASLSTAGLAEAQGPVSTDSCGAFEHHHSKWTNVLREFVHDGMVDYAGLKKRGQSELDAYLASLQAVCPGEYGRWTREQKLAFWINAYNAFAVRL